MSDLVQGLKTIFDRKSWVDRIAEPLQSGVKRMYRSGGRVGQKIADFLHGTWLGHPLHPVLTDIPIGAWTAAITLDAMESSSRSRGLGKAADAAVAVGVAGAVGSAAAGITDWMHLPGESRRTGFTHAALNTVALGLFVVSLVARNKNRRGFGKMMALAGFSIAGASAYLGGDLVFRQKIGVNHAPKDIDQPDFTPVLSENRLPESTLVRADLYGTPLVLLRRGENIYALAETCAHLGGPLADGTVNVEHSGKLSVTCPWHGSTFDLASGDVISGPSAYPQPCFEARIRDGQVEVRHRV